MIDDDFICLGDPFYHVKRLRRMMASSNSSYKDDYPLPPFIPERPRMPSSYLMDTHKLTAYNEGFSTAYKSSTGRDDDTFRSKTSIFWSNPAYQRGWQDGLETATLDMKEFRIKPKWKLVWE